MVQPRDLQIPRQPNYRCQSPRLEIKFSPRARGCSWGASRAPGVRGVFPACAGMFRRLMRWPPSHQRFPRVRGDVPSTGLRVFSRIPFSPRARGCSLCAINRVMTPPVFPACAGMFHRRRATSSHGVPFSPRARGCSALQV